VSDLATLTAIEQAQLIRDRKASPVEVVQAVLDRIEAWQPHLNAFAALDAERAMAAARAAEAQPAAGPLHGVPVTIKDVQAVAGLPTRRGSRLSSDSPATADAPLVARLKGAGGIVLGKTTATEQGWTAVSAPLTGHTHNPWMHGRTAGGSSSGAAAWPRGLRGAALGTDGAGLSSACRRISAPRWGTSRPSSGALCPVPNNNSISHAGPITAARPMPR